MSCFANSGPAVGNGALAVNDASLEEIEASSTLNVAGVTLPWLPNWDWKEETAGPRNVPLFCVRIGYEKRR
jgi:hypothetical protein